MATLKISVLGPFQVSTDENLSDQFETNKARALLAYLSVESHRSHSREALAELLWSESPAASVLGNLRYALANLRKVIGDASEDPAYLLINRESIQFNAASNHVLDAAEFTSLIQDGNIEKCEQAAALYRGDFLSGFPSITSVAFEEWILVKGEIFRQQMLETLHRIADHYEKQGEYEAALSFARRQVEIEPWHEEAHQQLMRILVFTGQRSAALAQFETCRRLLAGELDVSPSPETARLFEAIRDGGLGSRRPVYPDEDKVLLPLFSISQPDSVSLGETARAIDESVEAARSATRRFANEEAVAHYRHALELLKSLPDTTEKLEQELKLQTALGAALLSVRNFSNPEVAQAYQRAYELCQRIGNRPELFHVLKGLSSYYALCGEIYIGLDLGERLMQIAEEQQDDTLLVIAHNNRGVNLLFAGDLTAYLQHAQRVLEFYDVERHRPLALEMGYDPKVATLSHAIGLWMLGYPDQALEKVRLAVAWADHIQHAFSQCYSYFFLAHIHLLRREPQMVLETAEKLIALSQKQYNSFWYAQGLLVKGWAVAQMGTSEAGLQFLLQGFSIIRRTGSYFVLRASASWLGEVSGMAGRVVEGLSALDEFIAQSEKSGVLLVLSNQYQVRGELLVRLGRLDEAETSFQKAIKIARQQQAKGWELRAVLSLARQRLKQDRADEVCYQLRELVAWFQEGFGTLDLVEVNTLLGRLDSDN